VLIDPAFGSDVGWDFLSGFGESPGETSRRLGGWRVERAYLDRARERSDEEARCQRRDHPSRRQHDGASSDAYIAKRGDRSGLNNFTTEHLYIAMPNEVLNLEGFLASSKASRKSTFHKTLVNGTYSPFDAG